MKKITLLTLVVVMATLTTNSFAGNWKYSGTGTKWVKNITPEMFQYNVLNTTQVQANIVAALGGGNPTPAISTTSGQDLSNGYFAVCGGQITALTDPTPTNVRNGYNIVQETLGTFTSTSLRFATSAATISTGTKTSIGGYFNINWYIPTKYIYSGYKLNFTDSVYNPATFALGLLVYDESGTQLGTTQNIAVTGWNVASFAQSTTKPFRFKLSIPNTSGLICYFNTPKFELNSDTEPATRTVTVTTTTDGVVTPTYGNLHDQDIETFTITPIAGKVIDVASYNGALVTPVKNGSIYYYTTALLTADATFDVTYKNDPSTGISNNETPSFVLSNKGGLLQVDGLIAGQLINVYAIGGKQVFHSVATQSSTSISLSKGVYLVKVNGKISKAIL